MPRAEFSRPDRRGGPDDGQELLRTSDVAALFQVSTRTVSEWARRGRVPCVRTPGGQWRYPAEPIHRLVEASDHSAWYERQPLNGSDPSVRS